MRSFNLFHGELVDRRDRPGFSWRRTAVGRAIGAEKLGASVYELEPGERSFPYHYEYGNEEWLIVVAGRPTLRDPEGSTSSSRATSSAFGRARTAPTRCETTPTGSCASSSSRRR